MKKAERQILIDQFKSQFPDWANKKESENYVVGMWVSNIHEWWLQGIITLKDYMALLKVDILNT